MCVRIAKVRVVFFSNILYEKISNIQGEIILQWIPTYPLPRFYHYHFIILALSLIYPSAFYEFINASYFKIHLRVNDIITFLLNTLAHISLTRVVFVQFFKVKFTWNALSLVYIYWVWQKTVFIWKEIKQGEKRVWKFFAAFALLVRLLVRNGSSPGFWLGLPKCNGPFPTYTCMLMISSYWIL